MTTKPYDIQPPSATGAQLDTAGFERFAGVAAIATALASLAYALAFVVLSDPLLASVFLLLGGLLTTPTLTAVYYRLRRTHPGFAAWAVLLALAGAFGSAVHGGYDLANAVHPPATSLGALPNPVDLRGLLTFGIAGIGLLVIGALIVASRQFPRALGYLAGLSGLLLVVLYLARLIILDPTSPLVLVPALLTGFLVNPALYIWLGVALLRTRPR